VVGNALQSGSDVKLNGVPVGHVESIQAVSGGAELGLALNPDVLALLPDNVVAQLLPKTLFGERYVALVAPAQPSGTTLSAGDLIHQDASSEAAELQQLLDELLPILRAIQPDKLAAMMGELSTMLRDNGEDLGDAFEAWQDYVEKFNPLVPQMADDLEQLAAVAQEWEVAAPDLIDALATMTTTSQLLVDQQSQLRDVYASVISTSDTSRGWMSRNHDTIVILSRESRAALEASSPYAAQFPCLFEAVANYIPKMEKALGKGSGEPGIHAKLQVVPARKQYLAGKDDIRYTKGTPPPRCPYVTGKVGTTPASSAPDAPWPAAKGGADVGDEPATIAPPPGRSAQSHLMALSGLGDANSPGENQLIAELVAPTQGLAPGEYPSWNSLLLGPTLRNTKVVLQ
jgi:phospholipid/cholesterol/gamma-HCH transport system substrate-binding protein